VTGEEWDTREHVIKNDLINQGYPENEAREIAQFEATEQFGERPEETKQ
jgi:hypothetical protein